MRHRAPLVCAVPCCAVSGARSMALLLLATLVGVATARSAQVALPAPVVGRAEDVVVEDAEVVPGAGRLLLHGCHRHQCGPPPPPLLAAPVCTIATRHFHSLPMHVSGGHMSTLRWVRLSAHCPVSQSQRSWASQWRGRGGADSAWRGCAGVLSRARGAPSLRGVKTGTASAVGGCTAAPGLFVSPCWRMT